MNLINPFFSSALCPSIAADQPIALIQLIQPIQLIQLIQPNQPIQPIQPSL